MKQVIDAAVKAAPVVYRKADELAKKVSGQNLRSLVTRENGPELAGELLVRSGFPPAKLKNLLEAFSIHDSDAVMAHAGKFVGSEVQAMSNIAATPDHSGIPESIRVDMQCEQIKSTIGLLGLKNIAELLQVSAVINTLTAAQVKVYRDKGVLNPRLGYY